jgi:RNA polymerase sigma-70 factor (ECF subfamily)
VYRITWNVCSTASTRRPRPAEDWETRSDADPAPGPEETILRRDLLHRIGDAIHDLPDNYREAVLLKVVAELPYEEVAELLNVSVGTARTRVYRGMARLRERLQSQMDEEAL